MGWTLVWFASRSEGVVDLKAWLLRRKLQQRRKLICISFKFLANGRPLRSGSSEDAFTHKYSTRFLHVYNDIVRVEEIREISVESTCLECYSFTILFFSSLIYGTHFANSKKIYGDLNWHEMIGFQILTN